MANAKMTGETFKDLSGTPIRSLSIHLLHTNILQSEPKFPVQQILN
jgi:hypothetical protein